MNCQQRIGSHNIARLIRELPNSSSQDRDVWAKQVVSNEISLSELIPLLSLEYKVASRTLWLLSQIALEDPNCMQPQLPAIYNAFTSKHIRGGEASIVNQWLICGVPIEMESVCINQLSTWLASNEINITTKTRAIKVLLSLVEKYPELKIELRAYLERLREDNDKAFSKFAEVME